MYIDAIHRNDSIVSWLRLPNGELIEGTDPAPYYCFVDDINGQYTSLFGNTVSKKEFSTKTEFTSFLSSTTKRVWESDITPVYKFLSDNFYTNRDMAPMLHVGFLDIEIDYDLEDGRGYPSVIYPFGPINAVSVYNQKTDTFHMIYVSDYAVNIDVGNDSVIMYQCVNEHQLLDTLFCVLDDIDLVSGWNSDGLDIPYIHARAMLQYGVKLGSTKLCRGGYSIKIRDSVDRYDNEVKKYIPIGRVHLDFMELYKKFTYEEKPSYKLENIAQDELGYGKLPYSGDLGELYRTDRKTFLEYNLHDVRLLRDLERKKKLLELAVNMSRDATVKYEDVLGTIKYIEGCVRNYAHFDRTKKLIMPDKQHSSGEKYEGAYVVPTKAGKYSWTQSTDLASLYPSTIRALNISPETHIFQCKNNQADWIKIVQQSTDMVTLSVVGTSNSVSLPAFEIHQMILDENFTISAWGSIFNNEFYGLIPEILSVWYDERKALKKKSKEFENTGDIELAEFYDLRQHIRKINLNSAYGALGNQYCRFYSIDTAASITITGQHINMGQIWKADTMIKTAVDCSNA